LLLVLSMRPLLLVVLLQLSLLLAYVLRGLVVLLLFVGTRLCVSCRYLLLLLPCLM
jgi:hypothetical protein